MKGVTVAFRVRTFEELEELDYQPDGASPNRS